MSDMGPTSGSEEFLAAIDAAFPREPIAAANAFREWGTSYPDAPEYAAQLDGKSWDQLDASYLVRRDDALGFLGTKELVAVLPVYLRSLVQDGASSPAADMLMLVLKRPGTDDDPHLGKRRFGAFVDTLTDAQKAVIARVLARFVEQYAGGSPGERALTTFDSHWRAYLPGAANDHPDT